MKCPQCGFENKPDNLFGTQCRTNSVPRCPQCNSEIIAYSQFQPCTPKFLADKILTTRSSLFIEPDLPETRLRVQTLSCHKQAIAGWQKPLPG